MHAQSHTPIQTHTLKHTELSTHSVNHSFLLPFPLTFSSLPHPYLKLHLFISLSLSLSLSFSPLSLISGRSLPVLLSVTKAYVSLAILASQRRKCTWQPLISRPLELIYEKKTTCRSRSIQSMTLFRWGIKTGKREAREEEWEVGWLSDEEERQIVREQKKGWGEKVTESLNERKMESERERGSERERDMERANPVDYFPWPRSDTTE